MPCVAKHLLKCVLSTTPGNFFAEYTVNTSEKQDASTGALPVLTAPDEMYWELGSDAGVLGPPGTPTFTNENRRLQKC
jgi:hypothetical protein